MTTEGLKSDLLSTLNEVTDRYVNMKSKISKESNQTNPTQQRRIGKACVIIEILMRNWPSDEIKDMVPCSFMLTE